MSLDATRWAWDVPGLSTAQRVVLLRLADRARPDGRAWPSVAALADECGLGETATRRAIRDLEAQGVVAVDRPAGVARIPTWCPAPTPHLPRVYRSLNTSPPEGLNPSPPEVFNPQPLTCRGVTPHEVRC